MSLDPIAFGQQVARQTLAQDGTRKRHLTAVAGHLHNVRPSQPATNMLPTVELYDRAADDDRPTLPAIVDLAVSVLCRGVMVPTSVAHPQMVEAAQIVAMWRGGGVPAERDDAPAHGYIRPVTT